MFSADTWVHIAQTVLVGLLIAGRWLQARETGEGVTKRDIDKLTRAMEADHARVRELAEKTNEALGRIQIEARGDHERLRGLEEDVKELRRKVFNGGGLAGV